MNELLAKVLRDPSLSDVPSGAGRHELELLVAKAQRTNGVLQLQLTLRDGSTLRVEALPQWTVAQLKRSVERAIVQRLETTRQTSTTISWKQHWKRWTLVYDGAELDDGRRRLESYALASSAVLHFMPRCRKLREPTKGPAQKRRRTTHHTSGHTHKQPPVL